VAKYFIAKLRAKTEATANFSTEGDVIPLQEATPTQIATQPFNSVKPARTVAIIGTAGRSQVPTLLEWNNMLKDAESRITSNDTLISGGAAFADHIAVKLFLEGKVAGLKLRLPAKIKDGKFVGAYGTAGRTANYYHAPFSKLLGVDTIAEIEQAIKKGAEVTYETETSNKAMFIRNEKVAKESNAMIAYTYGEGNEPADGGTKDTWNKSKYLDKTHISINKIKFTPQSSTSVKPGVEELFESNPELANAVYEALGFKKKNIEEYKDVVDKQTYQYLDRIQQLEDWKTEPQPINVKNLNNYVKKISLGTQKGKYEVNVYENGKEINKYFNTQEEAINEALEYSNYYTRQYNNILFKNVEDRNSYLDKEIQKVVDKATENQDFRQYYAEMLGSEITPQQKQQAQQKFQEYVNSTGKQDIEGFKKFVSKSITQSSTSVKPDGITQKEWDGLSQEEKNKINEC
jgi:hypothetical protein